MIKSEAAQLVGYVYIDIDIVGRDPGRYVKEAKAMIEQAIEILKAYHLQWSGSFQPCSVPVNEEIKHRGHLTLYRRRQQVAAVIAWHGS